MAERPPDLRQAWFDLPRAYGTPPLMAELRARPADFQVREDLGVEPDGAGEHLWLQVRKTGWNTADVGQWLASALDCPPREVSWAGLKDRHAVTDQWFGVRMPGASGVPQLPDPPDGIRVLRVERHGRKLRTGMLRGNFFRLTLRDADGHRADLGRRLQLIARAGVPNYFGEQRFGRDGGNLDNAWRMLDGMPVRNRQRRGLFLSAARSFLFNRVLAERVTQGNWNRPVSGDLMTFSTSASLFPVSRLAPGDPRIAAGELHPSGPLPGREGDARDGAAAEIEAAVLQQWPEALAGLERLRVDAARRALRLPVRQLSWRAEENAVVLGFWLPAGAFATAVLREVCAQRERSRT